MKLKVIFLLMNFFIAQAFAQAPSQGNGPSNVKMNLKAGRNQTLNFDDELIEGNVQKPDLFYIFQNIKKRIVQTPTLLNHLKMRQSQNR